MLGNVKTSKQAWDILTKMFTSKTRARIMHLKERLSRSTKGSKSISEYLHGIKALSDELAIINSPLDDVDLVIHTLNGLGNEYREVTAAIRTRENPIGFDDLHDLLSDFENYLRGMRLCKKLPLLLLQILHREVNSFTTKLESRFSIQLIPNQLRQPLQSG